jgi:beta-phosphoglucomutase-like phosphatase (HAD superfamily)
MGVAPSECVVFEDSVSGFRAARVAGMYSVGVGEVALQAIGDDAPDLAIGSFNDLNPDRLFGARD